jgi:endogenous inhibitor of DNA gyrase (YacG/DUF329 family)
MNGTAQDSSFAPHVKGKETGLRANTGRFARTACKLIDLGKWLGGGHAISEPLREEHLEALKDQEKDL